MNKGFQQAFVNQTPQFDRPRRKNKSHRNQVINRRSGIIRPDKRNKVKFL